MSAIQKPQSLAIRLSRQYKSPQTGSKRDDKDIVKEEVKGSKKIKLDAPGNDGDLPKITKELEFDLNKPLKLVLKEVFDKEGTVILAFQGAPYNQVLKYANSINYQLQSHMDTKAQALTRQITDITGEDTECTSHDEDFGEDWITKVETVEVMISSFPSYIEQLEHEFCKYYGITPWVELVALLTSPTDYDHQRILTIDPSGGPVYFKTYDPNDLLDDCSLFLRVSYQIQKQEQSRIIWINVKTLLPIQYKEHENLFYAEFTQTSFHPSTPIDDDSTSKSKATPQTDDPDDGDIPHPLAHPFYYIRKIVDNPAFNYHIHGGTKAAIIYPAHPYGSLEKRISRGKADIHDVEFAILDHSEQKFDIRYYPVKDHTKI